MTSELNPINQTIIDEYIKATKERRVSHYIVTVSRDGEIPARSLVLFQNIEEAVQGYSMYKDAGFAKEYLTVSLYEPCGKINTKVLKRNQAGDPSFVRQNYIDAVEALFSVKNKLNKHDYEELCIKLLTSFAKDNWRFDAERFLKDLEIERTF
jgi:hypothetical protein